MEDERFEKELSQLFDVYDPNPGFSESDLDVMNYNDLLGGDSPQTPVANALIEKGLVPDNINPFVPFHHYIRETLPEDIDNFLERGNILALLVVLSENDIKGIEDRIQFIKSLIGKYYLSIDDDQNRSLWIEVFDEITNHMLDVEELLGDNPEEEIVSLMMNAIEDKALQDDLKEQLAVKLQIIQDIFKSSPALSSIYHDDLEMLQGTIATLSLNTSPELAEVFNSNINYFIKNMEIPRVVIDEIIQILKSH